MNLGRASVVSVFVGEGRKALVKGIINRLDKLTDYYGDSRACLISLEAPSGWGKTRIIQEVYKQLAERQGTSYWPHSIIPWLCENVLAGIAISSDII